MLLLGPKGIQKPRFAASNGKNKVLFLFIFFSGKIRHDQVVLCLITVISTTDKSDSDCRRKRDGVVDVKDVKDVVLVCVVVCQRRQPRDTPHTFELFGRGNFCMCLHCLRAILEGEAIVGRRFKSCATDLLCPPYVIREPVRPDTEDLNPYQSQGKRGLVRSNHGGMCEAGGGRTPIATSKNQLDAFFIVD